MLKFCWKKMNKNAKLFFINCFLHVFMSKNQTDMLILKKQYFIFWSGVPGFRAFAVMGRRAGRL